MYSFDILLGHHAALAAHVVERHILSLSVACPNSSQMFICSTEAERDGTQLCDTALMRIEFDLDQAAFISEIKSFLLLPFKVEHSVF
jgi:hypothetical protein